MADDAIEELPAVGAGGKGGSRGNPWMPVIAIVVLLPLTTFVMSEYLLIPRMKSALNISDTHATGDDKDQSGDKDGGGAHGAAYTYEFKNVVANLSGALKSRYLKVSFILEGSNTEFENIISVNEVRLIDTTLGILSSLTLADLEEPGVKNILRNDLIAAFSTTLDADIIEQLYFSELVVQ